MEPMLIAPKPLPMLPPVNAPTEVMAGCAAVVTVPAVVAVDALPVTLPVNAPTKVVAPSEPVEGFQVNFVLVVFTGSVPVLPVTQTGYIVAFVVVSLVIPAAVHVLALPTKAPTNPPAPPVTVPVNVGLANGAPFVLT